MRRGSLAPPPSPQEIEARQQSPKEELPASADRLGRAVEAERISEWAHTCPVSSHATPEPPPSDLVPELLEEWDFSAEEWRHWRVNPQPTNPGLRQWPTIPQPSGPRPKQGYLR
jgi:hypothetical protein